MAATGTYLILATGGITFTNEWIQTHDLNWRIPIATLLGAAAIDGIDHLSHRSATMLGALALLAGISTPIKGKSPIQELVAVLHTTPKGSKQSIQRVG